MCIRDSCKVTCACGNTFETKSAKEEMRSVSYTHLIAVDPLDGTTSTAKGLSNAIAVISIAPRGCLYNTKNFYMEKLAVGPKAKGAIDLEKPLKENLLNIAKALDKNIEDLTVTILERDRHKDIMAQCRQLGCRIKLFTDGDVGAAIATCFEDSGVDAVSYTHLDVYKRPEHRFFVHLYRIILHTLYMTDVYKRQEYG